MFNDEKWGYNKKEVDAFLIKQKAELNSTISNLKAQNIELKAEIEELNYNLKQYKQNEDSIKDAMILAAKKTREIEEQTAREYKLECEKVKKLYFKWVDIIEAVKKKYGLINTDELNVRRFYLDIENLFDNNLPVPREQAQIEPKVAQNVIEVNGAFDEQKIYHKQLLNRMSGLLHSVSTSVKDAESRKFASYKSNENNQKLASDENKSQNLVEEKQTQDNNFAYSEFKKETERLQKLEEDKKQNLESGESASLTNTTKPLNSTIKSLKSYSSLLDKYLSLDDEDESSMGAYTKVITNNLSEGTEIENGKVKGELSKALNLPQGKFGKGTNGFDLQEAVNPKQSLEEIMQAFDI